jgi:hypothetical protein
MCREGKYGISTINLTQSRVDPIEQRAVFL